MTKTCPDKIFENQLVKELTTNKVNKQWIKDLPIIIEELNEKLGLEKPLTDNFPEKYDQPLLTKNNNDILQHGDKVRLILDQPQTFSGKKLKPPFRSADLRWTIKVYEVDKVILQPNSPPLYLIKDVHGIAYTRAQLLRA